MRGLAISAAVLLILLGASLFGSLFVCNRLDTMADTVSRIDASSGDECITEAARIFESARPMLMLFMRDDIISDIAISLSECASAANANDTDALMAAKSRLLQTLLEVRRLSKPSFGSII